MPQVDFAISAYRHGLSKKEIANVLNDENSKKEEILSGGHSAFRVTGQISPGDPAEVIYREVGQDSILVFHAIRVF